MAQREDVTIVFGCGNLIMGDDGFGPAVIEALDSNYILPAGVTAVDAGTGIREYLFDYLLTSEGRPDRILIVDAVDFEERAPGEVFTIDTSAIPVKKTHDFSLHQFPTVNLLRELEEYTGTSVCIVVAQVENIPEEIEPGLSPGMLKAIPVACEKIMEILSAPRTKR